jgi:hypothetical protein
VYLPSVASRQSSAASPFGFLEGTAGKARLHVFFKDHNSSLQSAFHHLAVCDGNLAAADMAFDDISHRSE